MKIGIIGSGDVGRRLADGLLDLGHQVKVGTRDTSKTEVVDWIDKHRKKGDKESENASVGGFAEAASFGDLIVLCTAWNGTSNAIKMADISNMTGKVVIDTTNPLDFSQGLPPRMAVGVTDSAGEINQRLIPGAKVIKAFNIVGNPHMVHPDFPGGPPTMFICGNDEQAKKMVTESILT
ncbi:MAG: NAD(P)-binding domain-containing protein, partial [Nitrososphaeraceae archaeon]